MYNSPRTQSLGEVDNGAFIS